MVKCSRSAAPLAFALFMLAIRAIHAEESPNGPAHTCDTAHFRIALDVGHTENSYGQLSARGMPEFEFNKNLANVVLQALHSAGFPLAQTRIQKSNDLSLRARDLDSLHPDLILSLHHDGVQDKYLTHGMIDGVYREYSDQFAGYSLFVSYDNPERDNSILFAKLLGEELTNRHHEFTMHHNEKISGENRPVVDRNVGVFRYDRLVVLRRVKVPAVLMESAVIINPDDETRALKPNYQNEIAESVVAAVTRYCALRSRPAASPSPDAKRSGGPPVQTKPAAQAPPPPADAPAAQQPAMEAPSESLQGPTDQKH